MPEPTNRRSDAQRKRWAAVPEDQRREHMRAATEAGALANHMNGAHAGCDHPRTKAARLQCKRRRAKAAQS